MISIIIPAQNEKKNLEVLLPQLLNYGDNVSTEIIIALSPGSDDGSEDMVVADNVKFLRCSKKGRATQMNQASESARGNILVFLHADVKPPKSFFLDIKQTIDSGYEAGFFSYKFDKQGFLLKINAWFTGKDGLFTGGGDQCLFIKKDVFVSLGSFDENQVLMEDFEFFERMKKKNVRYTIVKNDLIVSARKYESNSYLRVNFSNLLLVILFKMGYPSRKLKTLHDKLLCTTYNG